MTVPENLFVWMGLAALAAIAAIAIAVANARRRRGPTGGGAPAVRERSRERPVLTVLAPGIRRRHIQEWAAIETRFTQVPVESLRDAERLVGSIMRDRGYPYVDAHLRSEALSPLHAASAEAYRDARRICRRLDDGSRVSTDEMRQALVDYRSVVQDLLELPAADDAEIERQLDETM